MSLLERIANSRGNPERTIVALRLINERLKRQLFTASGEPGNGLIESHIHEQVDLQIRTNSVTDEYQFTAPREQSLT